jgi:hypothetical protein
MTTTITAPLEREQKEEALAAVERSETFSRQEQLKAFLRFVCQYEFAGRGDEIHEYLIGIEVLGQPAGYSTHENAIVRNRAHSLRRKLQDFYLEEAPRAQVRIDIPKGSYCPRFWPVPSLPQSEDTAQPAMAPQAKVHPEGKTSKQLWFAVLGGTAACVLSIVLGFQWGQHRQIPVVESVIQAAWGPLLSTNGHTLVCIANVPQLLIRSLPDNEAVGTRLPDELKLDEWYTQRYTELPGSHLYFTAHHNSPLWGDASGAITVSRILVQSNVESEVLPERVQDAFALRDRNVILLGRPENSPAAALFLNGLYFNIKYFPDVRDQQIYFNDPRKGTPTELSRNPDVVHGLISVINSPPAAGKATRLVVLSGENSAGTVAAAEYFSSPDHMEQFRRRLRQDGFQDFPRIYQIVISAKSHSFLPFNYSLETYKVIER